MKKIAIGLVITLLIGFLGCAAFQDAVTPCWIDEGVGEYTGEPLKSIMPYTTLADEARLRIMMNYTHDTNQIHLVRQSEDDVRWVGLLRDVQIGHRRRAESLKETIFDPEGGVGVLVATLLGGTVGATLIPRKRDTVRIKELENLKV